MKLPRRKFLQLAAGAAALPAVPRIAVAQNYPTRPIRLVVAFTAGGTTDFMACLIADKLKRSLVQSVIVENRPGANGAMQRIILAAGSGSRISKLKVMRSSVAIASAKSASASA